MDYILVFWALLATLFTWGLTALGAAVVFFFKDIRAIVLDSMLALASGVMIAASFWSLLLPGRDIALEIGQSPALVLSLGFLTGAGFLILVNRLIPHLHFKDSVPSGRKSSLSRSVLLVLAISIHNIPEGLAIGVAFGSLAKGETLAGAVALAYALPASCRKAAVFSSVRRAAVFSAHFCAPPLPYEDAWLPQWKRRTAS